MQKQWNTVLNDRYTHTNTRHLPCETVYPIPLRCKAHTVPAELFLTDSRVIGIAHRTQNSSVGIFYKEQYMKIFTVAFFGHRYIDNPFRIEERLEEEIRRLLSEHEYVDFLVGRDGEFDQLASSAVLRVRKQNRDDNSSLVLVLPYARAEYLNNEDSYQDYYSDVEISYAASKAHPKAAIQIRNREMVDRADLVLCYIERKSGGAYQTVLYAKKQNKQIINLQVG